MSNVFSFYFDGSIVQALKACISSNSVTIKDALTFPLDGLDDYLSGCGEKTFIICCNPLLFHQDIVYLPPAASSHYDKLVRTEVQKIHPELTSFTSFHRTVGQATIDSKVHNKIAAFSYTDDTLSSFISVFNLYNKVISHIYAAPYSIFRLAASTCVTDPAQARIFTAALPGEKLLLVSENKELEFIRKIPSPDATLLPADTQNINMTVDYCFQSFRVKPLEVVTLNQPETSEELSQLLTVPIRSALSPVLASVPRHVVQDYLAPLAAALHYFESPHVGDILPSDYVSFSRNKKVLSTASKLMIALALLLAGFTLTEWLIISDLKPGIGILRSHLSNSGEEVATYRKLDEEVKFLNQRLKFIQKHNPATALASLTLPSSDEYSIKSILIQDVAGSLGVQIQGDISASGLSDTQIIFERIVGQIGKIPGYTVKSSTLDIKQKTFIMQARYSSSVQKGK